MTESVSKHFYRYVEGWLWPEANNPHSCLLCPLFPLRVRDSCKHKSKKPTGWEKDIILHWWKMEGVRRKEKKKKKKMQKQPVTFPTISLVFSHSMSNGHPGEINKTISFSVEKALLWSQRQVAWNILLASSNWLSQLCPFQFLASLLTVV